MVSTRPPTERSPLARSLRIALAVLALVAAPAAAAIELPPDAELIVTSQDSTIVGYGRSVGGTTFELTVLPSYSGPATLTLLLPDGASSRLEVVLDAGRVTIDGVVLRELLLGYDEVRLLTADDGAPASQPAPARRPNAGREGPPASSGGEPARPDAGPPEPPAPARDAAPEDVPDGRPDDVPAEPGGAAPDAVPDAVPDAAPDAVPDAAPEAGRDDAPGAPGR